MCRGGLGAADRFPALSSAGASLFKGIMRQMTSIQPTAETHPERPTSP